MEHPVKSFTCGFCQRCFNRADALKRHLGTCSIRQKAGVQAPQMPQKARGKKPRACDRCSRLRRACTSGRPCATCTRSQMECTYNRVRQSRDEEQAESLQYHSPQQTNSSLLPCSGLEDLTECNSASAFLVADTLGTPVVGEQPWFDMSCASLHSAFSSDSNTLPTRALLQESIPIGLLFPRPTELNFDALKAFPFLKKLASVQGLSNTFECGDFSQRSTVTQNTIATSLECAESLAVTQSVPDRLYSNFSEIDIHAVDISTAIRAGIVDTSEQVIAAVLRGTISDRLKPQHVELCNQPLDTTCRHFFAPSNLQRYLSLYWLCWHPNWPVMHKPSFLITKASPALVAAMAVIGACLSTLAEDCALARIVFDAVEEIVFNNESFSMYDHPAPQDGSQMRHLNEKLEILLAAYCVCLYQTWEGCKLSKKRVRRLRYNQIISLARDIGPCSASLKGIDTTQYAAFNWTEFALRESLVRTFAYINNLDTGFAMFYQEPIRMHISELLFDLSAPEACFAAESAEDCFAALKVWRDTLWPLTSISLTTAVTMICSPNQLADVERIIPRLSVLSMFTLISTLYKLAIQVESSLLFPAFSPALQQGLNNWRRFWPSEHRDYELLDITAHSTGQWFRRLGFQRHAPEYWMYTYLTLERARLRSCWDHAIGTQSIDFDDIDMKQFRQVLREFRNMEISGA